MKKFINITLAFLIAFSVSYTGLLAQDKAENKNIKIKTSAYSWMCKNKIESELKKTEGVEFCYLNLTNKVVEVKFNKDVIKSEKIKELIEKLGYTAEVMKDENTSSEPTNIQEKKEIKS